MNFVEELGRATEAIRDVPDRWPIRINSTRRFLLWRFPFTIIYSQKQTTITIWAVAQEADGLNTGLIGCDLSSEF